MGPDRGNNRHGRGGRNATGIDTPTHTSNWSKNKEKRIEREIKTNLGKIEIDLGREAVEEEEEEEGDDECAMADGLLSLNSLTYYYPFPFFTLNLEEVDAVRLLLIS